MTAPAAQRAPGAAFRDERGRTVPALTRRNRPARSSTTSGGPSSACRCPGTVIVAAASTAFMTVGYRHIVDLADAWERNAGEWIAWARAPGHDGFWESTWPALREILPAPGGTVLDLGCGEGRLGRLLQAAGFRVIGIDRSPTLTRAAATASPAFPVAVAAAAALPIISEGISLVVASMSLHDIDDLTGAIREASRVLEPGGQFCITIVHPFVTAQDNGTLHTDQFPRHPPLPATQAV